jgi:hypothetical protein
VADGSSAPAGVRGCEVLHTGMCNVR